MAHIEYDHSDNKILCYGAKDAKTAAAMMQKDLANLSKKEGWLYEITSAVEYCPPENVHSAFIRPTKPLTAENMQEYLMTVGEIVNN
jgi:hypothetical protein